MATEREQARERYLQLREQALAADKKARLAKVWTDTHYLLSGALIIAAIIFCATKQTDFSGGQLALAIALWVVAVLVWVALGTIPSRKHLRQKKCLHELQQQLDDLERKYRL